VAEEPEGEDGAVGAEGDVDEEELQPQMVKIKATDRVAVRMVIEPPITAQCAVRKETG
jgi:hypothetical protein